MNERRREQYATHFQQAFADELADALDPLVTGFVFHLCSGGSRCFDIRTTDAGITMSVALVDTTVHLSHLSFANKHGHRKLQTVERYDLADPHWTPEKIAGEIAELLNRTRPYDQVTDLVYGDLEDADDQDL